MIGKVYVHAVYLRNRLVYVRKRIVKPGSVIVRKSVVLARQSIFAARILKQKFKSAVLVLQALFTSAWFAT